MNNRPTGHPGCCGQPSRTGTVFTCLPNWVFGKTTANEKAVLLTLQFHAPNIHPSLTTLAKESGLSQRTVQRVLGELEAKGWVAKEGTTTAAGGKGANTYRLLIWQADETADDAETSGHWSQWPGGYGQAGQGGMVTVANKREQSSNKRNPTALEPPLPPAGGQRRPEAVATGPCRDEGQVAAAPEPQPSRDRDGFLIHPGQPPAAAPAAQPRPAARPAVIEPQLLAATQPQPQQPNAPRPLPEPPDPEADAPVNPKGQRRRAAGFQPIEGDVPAALLPIARELLAFWACKGGKRTERAWAAQLGQLERIQDDARGGTEAVRAQLEAGSQAAVFGKPWMAVTFANWERYGRPATPIMGSGFGGKRTTMDRVMGAIALVEERERRAAAAQPVDRSGLVLAGVA